MQSDDGSVHIDDIVITLLCNMVALLCNLMTTNTIKLLFLFKCFFLLHYAALSFILLFTKEIFLYTGAVCV